MSVSVSVSASTSVSSTATTLVETASTDLETHPLLLRESSSDSTASVSSIGTVTSLSSRRIRRHSFHSHIKQGTNEAEPVEDHVLLKLDLFLSHLEQRLSALEAYGSLKLSQLDSSLQAAYETLRAVRESGGQTLGGELIGSGTGRRRGEALLSFLETRQDFSGWSESSSPSVQGKAAKVAAGMRFLEQRLADLEESCYASVDNTVRRMAHLPDPSEPVQVADVLDHAVVEALAKSARLGRWLHYHELPVPWRENPNIRRGYRFYSSYAQCTLSMFKVHNETCNIWTHLLGFVLVLSIALHFLPQWEKYETLTLYDKLVVGVFLFAALKCLFSSVLWHTYNAIGILTHKKRWACVDYSGISILIACSILTTQYTSFYCQPATRVLYMSVTAMLGVVGLIMAWTPSFDQPQNRWLRISFFVGLALSGGLGVIHCTITRGPSPTFWFILPILKSLGCYVAGVAFYGTLFPECTLPGHVFDYVFMSHNFWHLAVVGGIYYHYTATQSFLEGAREFSCSA
ncbi:hemolysin-III related-domain-containing protein [Lipomyces oligophaga]|uniref:hemolysin-III related-domain-containing protein n=1 Tax=Lipomyces oligophaga TaxID=45792 RepID=UPI0034CF5FAC